MNKNHKKDSLSQGYLFLYEIGEHNMKHGKANNIKGKAFEDTLANNLTARFNQDIYSNELLLTMLKQYRTQDNSTLDISTICSIEGIRCGSCGSKGDIRLNLAFKEGGRLDIYISAKSTLRKTSFHQFTLASERICEFKEKYPHAINLLDTFRLEQDNAFDELKLPNQESMSKEELKQKLQEIAQYRQELRDIFYSAYFLNDFIIDGCFVGFDNTKPVSFIIGPATKKNCFHVGEHQYSLISSSYLCQKLKEFNSEYQTRLPSDIADTLLRGEYDKTVIPFYKKDDSHLFTITKKPSKFKAPALCISTSIKSLVTI